MSLMGSLDHRDIFSSEVTVQHVCHVTNPGYRRQESHRYGASQDIMSLTNLEGRYMSPVRH